MNYGARSGSRRAAPILFSKHGFAIKKERKIDGNRGTENPAVTGMPNILKKIGVFIFPSAPGLTVLHGNKNARIVQKQRDLFKNSNF